MTNLADLLPAGGGQNNTDFVADGNISAGAPVILTAAGKAAPITGSTTAAAVQTEVEFLSSATNSTNLVWDSTNSKAVVFYTRAGVGFCKVGSLSGSTLTWGTETSIIGYPTQNNAVCFDSTGNKIIFMYEDGSGTYYTKAIVGEISGSSISFPGISYNVWANANNSSHAVTYDSTNDRIVFAARVWSNYYGEAKVASLSGTALTFGTAVTFESASTDMIGMGFDSTAGKVLIAYRDGGNSSYGTAIVGTVGSGTTTISFGTAAVFNSADSQLNQVAHDPTANKNLIAYYDPSAGYSFGVVATISGTSVTFGTPVNSCNSVTVSTSWDRAPVVYNAAIKKPVFLYQESASPYNLKYSIGTITGTAIAFSDHTTIGPYEKRYPAAVYDPATKQMITAFRTDSPDEGQSYVFNQEYTTTNLTSTNLLGLAPEAISDTATGTINTWGSRCESSSLLADSLSLASADTTSGNTNKENVSMAYDSNADRTILVYRDGGDSDKLKCIIGTLSGTSTSWGTAVEIVGATAGNRGTAVVYDSNAQRVLIAYTKSSDNYAYVRVGEISGTSVTLGTEVAASSSNSYYPELSYDVADQKVLLVFANAGDNYYPYSAACTITAVGNSVAVTTPASVASRNAYDPFGLAYNVNDGKHVLDITDNTSTGYAYVLTMSSGSISVGAEASYSPGFTPRQSFCVYDSSAQKIVRGYYSNSDPRPVEFAVASISGTNVSFGTAATCFAGNSGMQVSGTFYSSINQLAFFNMPFATTSVETNFGTVSGTTITFGTATTVASSGVSSGAYFDITYDSTAQKLIYAYRASTFDAVVGSFGTTPLTVTSDYYVQADGTISTTSTSPAQLIGNAIKTNQINIKDYTG